MEQNEKKYNGSERRKYPRINAFVTYAILAQEDKEQSNNAKNIGAGGIAIFAKEKVEINTLLSLAISLPDGSDLKTKAKVVWGENIQVSWDSEICYELGIEFIDIDDQDRQKIAQYVLLRLNRT